MHKLSALIAGYSWGSSGFGLWLQLVCCTYLLALSEYLKKDPIFRLQVKSGTSLHRGECRKMMKLEVWPSESAFGVTVRAVKTRFSSIMYTGWCKLYKSIFKMGHNTHEQTNILMPRVGANGVARVKNQGCVQE